jgi:hypothetical protein
LFSFIGRVFEIVKNDAIKAHNAFFPFLCDPEKLREHGKALMIPELPFDTEDGFRNRVATASFYLMRAGERAYIHEQLGAHLGDRYLLTEDFLQVYIHIEDLDEERIWILSFLDGILDPNISFRVYLSKQGYAEVFGGISPRLDGVIHLKALEDEAVAYATVVPSVIKTIQIPAEEHETHAYTSVIPEMYCVINILGEVIS